MRNRRGSIAKSNVEKTVSSSSSSTTKPTSSTFSSYFTFPVAFTVLALARITAVWYINLITDCDESMNYWEPTHYLLYGRGLQTWEYAPQYALRSYAYTWIHALFGLVSGAAWGADKIAVFHRTRMILALVTALCETVFYRGVAHRFGARIGTLTLFALVSSAGLAHAAPAYLPSSFTMAGLTACWGFWLHGQPYACIVSAVVGLMMGWPFALVALAPMGAHMFLTYCLLPPHPVSEGVKTVLAFISTGVFTTVATLGIGAIVDYEYYGTWLIAPWNIIKYNALGQGGGGQGSNLYGEEPFHFFASNLVLNFNILAVLAALSPIAVGILMWNVIQRMILSSSSSAAGKKKLDGNKNNTKETIASASAFLPTFITNIISSFDQDFPLTWLFAALSQLWFWFFIMSIRPHKEERFMFVVYPLIAFASAVTMYVADKVLLAPIVDRVLPFLFSAAPAAAATVASKKLQLRNATTYGILFLAFLLSGSRIMALVNGYSAPFHAWTVLGRHLAPQTTSSSSSSSSSSRSVALPIAERFPGWAEYINKDTDAMLGGVLPGSRAGARVCVGKEWYRFPTLYFLPERTRMDASAFPDAREHTPGGPAELGFLRSGFTGQLPQPYLPLNVNGTRIIRDGFNDENKQETVNRFVPLESCDYIIDLQLPEGRTGQPEFEPYFTYEAMFKGDIDTCKCVREKKDGGGDDDAAEGSDSSSGGSSSLRWHSLYSLPFLDAESSPFLARAFWVPGGYSQSRAVWGTYHVLQKIDCCRLPQQ